MNNKALEFPCAFYKPTPKYSLEVLDDFPEFENWLNEISRFDKVKDFIRKTNNFVFISDYKEKERITIRIFTKDHQYSISARLPKMTEEMEYKMKQGDKYDESITKDNGYLGCIVQSRKPRAGESWNRGNDLADGSYSENTWKKIKDDIIAYEMVKVVRNSKDIDEDKKHN